MTYSQLFQVDPINAHVLESLNASETHIKRTLGKRLFHPEDLLALLSPNMAPHLEILAQKSHALTIQRHGRIMQLFIPLYLSNECYNTCTYCGFSIENKFPRVTLSDLQLETELTLLKEKGFDHILLLTGEAQGKVDTNYIARAIKHTSQHFSSVGIEVQPMSKDDYLICIMNGADSLTLYQETYHPDAYKSYHLRGFKKFYSKRLDAVDYACEAGIYKLNIGALLGLYDWRFEAFALAHHLQYLQKKYWKTKLAISFPRITAAEGNFISKYPITDKEYVQLICAFRLCFPDIGITLSTRENPIFRNNILKLGITTISAESNTSPGGYSGEENMEQFSTSDHRTLEEIKAELKRQNYEAMMKDWSPEFIKH